MNRLENFKEVFVSTDVEADGPIPGVYSMLSFASAAFLADKTLLGTFEANLDTLPGATTHPETMDWWKTQRSAWDIARMNTLPPEKAMADYTVWLQSLPGKLVFAAYPAAFDFMFVQWYLYRFTGGSPFSHSALDIKTFAMALMRKPYRETVKSSMPSSWFGKKPHTHRALDDALEQGELFCNMLAQNAGGEGMALK